jgi:single-stranded DNA-binding protein
MSVRAIMSGAVGKVAELRTSKNGNPFAIASIRESLNGSTRWWQVIAFDKNAVDALKEMSVGEPIAVAGEIGAEIYSPPGGEQRLNWRITVDAVLSARKPPKSKAEDASSKPKANSRDRAGSSWASPTPVAMRGVSFNDDVPFAPEWR